MTWTNRMLLRHHQTLMLVMTLVGLYLAISACGHKSLEDFMNN